ncbi:MAG TPA: metal ABC transporter permease [Rhodothermales bacterium]|nr:metal ABC transporter permease [Rhodothermales bacterium]
MSTLFALDFVRSALIVSVIMGLLLSYLGVHVVGRGIVFVDLALGQISMLGVAFAAFIGEDPTVISIVFTLAGAFILSFIKVSDKRLKQEAIIGIIYAFTSALTVLLISKTAHGDADISEVLFGSVFTATHKQILWMAGVFGILGLMHFIFRRRFFEITEHFEQKNLEELGVFNLWNFLFYLSIGLAIVLAVRVGGVIPVFSYLVVPSVSAILFTRGKASLVLIALLVSLFGSFFGIYFSVQFDFPAGSSIVTVLGIIFVLAALFRLVRGRREGAAALAPVEAGRELQA